MDKNPQNKKKIHKKIVLSVKTVTSSPNITAITSLNTF